MKRMGWGSSKSSKFFQTKEEEVAAMNNTMHIASWVMDDRIFEAIAEVRKSTSPFHKLGLGAGLFWDAVLSFEKSRMIEAGAALSEGESECAEFKKAAASGKCPVVYQSKIYPDGSEFAMAEAMCQLLGAILGILKESWLESLGGLNKLRKAYFLVQSLVEAEKKYIKLNPVPAQSRTSLVDSRAPSKQHTIPRKPVQPVDDDDDSDDEFFDADDDAPEEPTSNGHPVAGMADLSMNDSATRSHRTGSILSTAKSNRSVKSVDEPVDFRLVTTDPVDLFIHVSANMCWGIIQILLSYLPPAFRHILSMFNFRGDRDNGLRILWEATNYKDNIFGSISGMVVLLYHNIGVALSDILLRDAVPEARVVAMLKEFRQLYPNSQLWRNEEARIAINNCRLEEAVDILAKPVPGSKFEAMQGLRVFELGLDLMFLHRFQECADTFVYCCKVNRWSHGMYYYIAAMCNVEMYRDLKHTDPAAAKKFADKAKEILKSHDVHTAVKQKAMLGQQMPFDAFIEVKLDKWEARAKSQKCDLIDAIGVSPIEEFNYFWTGYRRMTPKQSQVCLSRLLAWEATAEWMDVGVDERASSAVLRAICLRKLGRPADARALMKNSVFCYSEKEIRNCSHSTNYPHPLAHYETGVCLWVEAGGESGDMGLLRQAKAEVEIAANASSWMLEDRMVVKLMNAKETFSKLGV